MSLRTYTSWYWVLINIGNQVPQFYKYYFRPDSQIDSQDTYPDCDNNSVSIYMYFLTRSVTFPVLASTQVSQYVLLSSLTASLPQLLTALTNIPLGQFIFNGCKVIPI